MGDDVETGLLLLPLDLLLDPEQDLKQDLELAMQHRCCCWSLAGMISSR